MPPIRGASRTTTCSTSAVLSVDFCRPFGGLRERQRVPHRLCFRLIFAALLGGLRERRRAPHRLCFRLIFAAHSGGFENDDAFHIGRDCGRFSPSFWGGFKNDDVFHIDFAHALRQWVARSGSVPASCHLLGEWGSGLRDRPVFVRFRRLDGDSPRRGAGVARAAEAEQKLIHIPQVGYPGWAGKPAFRRRILAQTGVSRGG